MSSMDDTKIVYVVSSAPSFEGASVGGFSWFLYEDDARRALIRAVRADLGDAWSHDYTMRSIPVPKNFAAEQIRSLLDEEYREHRELPLPEEWEPIRGTGGAVDLTEGADE